MAIGTRAPRSQRADTFRIPVEPDDCNKVLEKERSQIRNYVAQIHRDLASLFVFIDRLERLAARHLGPEEEGREERDASSNPKQGHTMIDFQQAQDKFKYLLGRLEAAVERLETI